MSNGPATHHIAPPATPRFNSATDVHEATDPAVGRFFNTRRPIPGSTAPPVEARYYDATTDKEWYTVLLGLSGSTVVSRFKAKNPNYEHFIVAVPTDGTAGSMLRELNSHLAAACEPRGLYTLDYSPRVKGSTDVDSGKRHIKFVCTASNADYVASAIDGPTKSMVWLRYRLPSAASDTVKRADGVAFYSHAEAE